MNQINKSNVTMWKNRDATKNKLKTTNFPQKSKSNQKMEESSKIENDFIDNLKKQIYFMEMELKLMKEREREIAKRKSNRRTRHLYSLYRWSNFCISI